jgi:hypothetical protein
MRAVVCFLALLLAFSTFAKASSAHLLSDTTKRSLHVLDSIGKKPLQKTDYELSRTEFTQRYGFDENANKIINFYFDKLEETKAEKRYILLLYLLTLIPVSILGTLLFLHFLGILYASLFFIILLMNLVLFVNNLLDIRQMQEIYSKSKLLKTLISYKKTKQFPDAIKKYKKKEKLNRMDDIE